MLKARKTWSASSVTNAAFMRKSPYFALGTSGCKAVLSRNTILFALKKIKNLGGHDLQ